MNKTIHINKTGTPTTTNSRKLPLTALANLLSSECWLPDLIVEGLNSSLDNPPHEVLVNGIPNLYVAPPSLETVDRVLPKALCDRQADGAAVDPVEVHVFEQHGEMLAQIVEVCWLEGCAAAYGRVIDGGRSCSVVAVAMLALVSTLGHRSHIEHASL